MVCKVLIMVLFWVIFDIKYEFKKCVIDKILKIFCMFNKYLNC